MLKKLILLFFTFIFFEYSHSLELDLSQYTVVFCKEQSSYTDGDSATHNVAITFSAEACGNNKKMCLMRARCSYVDKSTLESKYQNDIKKVPARIPYKHYIWNTTKENPELFYAYANVGCVTNADSPCPDPTECYKQKSGMQKAEFPGYFESQPINRPATNLKKGAP